ncbi:MAG TPA: hypothetical protein VG672_08675, partial [Bryobacteraceae bacterium]|nr:hypothetical protein [Bryobacteraceae bacterium]
GVEPGLYADSSPGYPDLKPHHPYLLPVAGKHLVNNIGLLRVQEVLAEGWKPVMVEDGRREYAERMVGFMSPLRVQLAMAENMMFGIALEQYVEARPAHQLITGDPAGTDTWQSVGKYNRFFEQHEDLYTGARSRAPLAVVLDDRSEGIPLLDGLAARRVLFEPVYERDITAEGLARYKAVAVLTARSVRESALAALRSFQASGGNVILAGGAALFDENGVRRERPALSKEGKGRLTDLEQIPPIQDLANLLLESSGPAPVEVTAPPHVLWNVTEQPAQKRTLVHLLNYSAEPVNDLSLRVRGRYKAATLVSPDGEASFTAAPAFQANEAGLRLPKLRTYSVITLNWK